MIEALEQKHTLVFLLVPAEKVFWIGGWGPITSKPKVFGSLLSLANVDKTCVTWVDLYNPCTSVLSQWIGEHQAAWCFNLFKKSLTKAMIFPINNQHSPATKHWLWVDTSYIYRDESLCLVILGSKLHRPKLGTPTIDGFVYMFLLF